MRLAATPVMTIVTLLPWGSVNGATVTSVPEGCALRERAPSCKPGGADRAIWVHNPARRPPWAGADVTGGQARATVYQSAAANSNHGLPQHA